MVLDKPAKPVKPVKLVFAAGLSSAGADELLVDEAVVEVLFKPVNPEKPVKFLKTPPD